MKISLSNLTLLFISAIVVNLVLIPGNSIAVDSKTAVGIWLFDEGGGNEVKDISPKGNHGKLVKSPKGDSAAWVKGTPGTALAFDGKGGHMLSSSKSGISGAANRSVVFWFKPAADKGRQSIVTWGSKAPKKLFWVEYNGYKGAPNNIYVGGWDADAYTEAKLTLNKWHHVAAVHPGLVDKTKIYYNGVSQKVLLFPADVKGDKGKLATVDSPVAIGYDHVFGRQSVKGAVDEVGIFNVALTEADVKAIMKNGLKAAALGATTAVYPSGKLTTAWGLIKDPIN